MKDYIKNWREEKCSAYLYRIIAAKELGNYQLLFQQLGQAAEQQAEIWQRKLEQAGQVNSLKYRPDLRTRLIGQLIRYFGPRQLRPLLAAMKVRGLSVYSPSPIGHPMPTDISEVGRRHRKASTGGNLRAAVFGINDGLVSNASLIMGMLGASSGHGTIILAGVAGLLAGAFSMAAGEFVSVRSQREMFEYQIELEREELEQYPEEESAELALIYQARGLTKIEAQSMAATIIQDKENALDVLAVEELGINPKELGSPWGAAISSFISFTIGAFIPLLPFLLRLQTRPLFNVIICTGLALFGIGMLISLFTGRKAWWSGLRMLLIGIAAGLITYFIGHLLGGVLS